jgi:hypothetical protein
MDPQKPDDLAANVKGHAGTPTLKFAIKILINTNITITGVDVQGVAMDLTKLHPDPTDQNLLGTVDAFVATLNFRLRIDAAGVPQAETTFTITCEGSAVFKTPQTISIGNTGFGGYNNSVIPLPS